MTVHKSDCAVHNEPYMPNGPCDCGAADMVVHGKWHPINTAPARKMVVVWGAGGMRFAIKDQEGQWRTPMGHPKPEPKFWMLLPKPPGSAA